MSDTRRPKADATEGVKNTFSDQTTKDPREHMEAMGAAKGKGQFTAMPPSQHRAFLDISQSQDNRVLAAVWERVVVPNNQDWTLAAFARESNERKTPTGVKDIGMATGMSSSNVSEALQRLEKRGIIEIQRKPFRIYLCYYVPKPNIEIKGEAKKERMNVLCTSALNSQKIKYLEQLQHDRPETFKAVMARLVGQTLYNQQRDADALAWSRERSAEQWEQRFTETGYTETEKRGRERSRPPSNPEAFKPSTSFEEFYAQKEQEIEKLSVNLCVQNGEIIEYTNKKNSAQRPHPYALTTNSLTHEELATNEGVNAAHATSMAEIKLAARIAEIKIDLNALVQQKRLRVGMGAGALTANATTTIAAVLAKLGTAGAVAEVIDTLAARITDWQNGKREVDDIGKWLYGIAKSEVDARLAINVKAAAAAKGMR